MIPQHGTLEISRARLRHNLALLRQQLSPNTQLCATIKANAYGHGVDLLASLLQAENIAWAAVYSLHEAIALARSSSFNIITLSPIMHDAQSAHDFLDALGEKELRQIRFNITDPESIHSLATAAQKRKLPFPLQIHIQLDTGLTRIGATPASITQLATAISASPALHLEGLFAHLSHGDVPDHPTLRDQLAALTLIATQLRQLHPHLLVHLQNSGGLFNIPASNLFNLARVGIALYGLQPSTDAPIKNLQPVARVTAPILAIHDRPAGTGVGYGHLFTTSQNSRIAIVPVGYADGYPRLLSNNSLAQLLGQSVPVVGRVSMDQIILDITHLPSAQIGDTVTVISHDPAHLNSLDRMADTLGTIGYELATHLGPRLARTIVD